MGRKTSILVSSVWALIFSLLSVVAPTYYIFLAVRFLAGIGVGGVIPVAVTYMVECLPDNSRGRYLMIGEMFRSSGMLLTTVIAWMSVGNLSYFLVLCSFFLVIIIISTLIFLNESVKYLSYKNDTDRVILTLNRISIENGYHYRFECDTYEAHEQREGN